MDRDIPLKLPKLFLIHTSVKNSKLCIPNLFPFRQFLTVNNTNPALAVKCSLFHPATCFGPVGGQQLIVLKFLSDGTVVACSELTSLPLYCCIILGMCCTLTACRSSAPLGIFQLISVGILIFSPEDGTAGLQHVGMYQA